MTGKANADGDKVYRLAGPYVAWFVGSGLFFIALNLGIKVLLNFSQDPSTIKINEDFRRLIPPMTYGYFCGFVGAALRMAIDAQKTGEMSPSEVHFSDRTKIGRLFVGSIFGVLAFFLLHSQLLQTFITGIDPSKLVSEAQGNRAGDVPIMAILSFGTLAGLFAGEMFGKLESRLGSGSTNDTTSETSTTPDTSTPIVGGPGGAGSGTATAAVTAYDAGEETVKQ